MSIEGQRALMGLLEREELEEMIVKMHAENERLRLVVESLQKIRDKHFKAGFIPLHEIYILFDALDEFSEKEKT